MKIGVIAIQGDFEKHINAFHAAGHTEVVEVRTPEELAEVDRVVIPGGESTTVGLLMQRFGLGQALKEAGQKGTPIWGTCMGMILLASEVEGRSQYSLNLLDITVQRNAFGAQIHSFEDEVNVVGMETPAMGVFIRAPIVTRVGDGVEVLSRYDDKIVAVRSGNIIGTSFHPELTDDTRFHQWFLSL